MGRNLNRILRFFARRSQIEREMDAELRFHIEHQTQENIRRGMTPAEARRAARMSVGGIEGVKEECRDARLGRTVESALQDVRCGARTLRKNPGFALTAIVTLALGVGANTAIFSVVYGILLRPLPYRNGGELVVLQQQATKAQLLDVPFSAHEIADYRDGNHTLAGVVEHHTMSFLLLAKNSAERVNTAVVSPNFFDVLGVKPLMGRAFVASDDSPNADAVLVLSYKYWQTRHGGDPNIVGKVFQMNNRPHTVIGVLPPIPQYPTESDVYMPTSACPTRSSKAFIENRQARMMTAFGRLKPGVPLARAQADLSTIAARLQKSSRGVSEASRVRAGGGAARRRFDAAGAHHFSGSARGGRVRPVDRVRERGESAARPLAEVGTCACRAERFGSEPVAAHAPAANRERFVVAGWRSAGHRAGALSGGLIGQICGAIYHARGGGADRCAGHVVCRASLDRDGDLVRTRPGVYDESAVE